MRAQRAHSNTLLPIPRIGVGRVACTAFLLHAARPLFTLTLQYMHTFHLQLRTVIRPNRTLLLAYISFRTLFFISCFVPIEIESRLTDCVWNVL